MRVRRDPSRRQVMQCLAATAVLLGTFAPASAPQRMIRSEFEELMRLSLEAGTIEQSIAYEKYVDEQFARRARPAVVRM